MSLEQWVLGGVSESEVENADAELGREVAPFPGREGTVKWCWGSPKGADQVSSLSEKDHGVDTLGNQMEICMSSYSLQML